MALFIFDEGGNLEVFDLDKFLPKDRKFLQANALIQIGQLSHYFFYKVFRYKVIYLVKFRSFYKFSIVYNDFVVIVKEATEGFFWAFI